MRNKNRNRYGIVHGAVAIGVGSSVVGNLPDSPIKTGVQSGYGTAASYVPSLINVGVSGNIVQKLRKLNRRR